MLCICINSQCLLTTGGHHQVWEEAQWVGTGCSNILGKLQPLQTGCLLYFLLLFCKAGTATQDLLTTTVTEAGSSHKPMISENCWISYANLLCKDQCLPGMGQTTPFHEPQGRRHSRDTKPAVKSWKMKPPPSSHCRFKDADKNGDPPPGNVHPAHSCSHLFWRQAGKYIIWWLWHSQSSTPQLDS